MSYLIKKWYLPKEGNTSIVDYTFKPTADWLDKLSKVNIFVGPNNSGKSRLLRYLISLETENFSPSNCNLDELREKVASFLNTTRKAYENIAGVKSIIPVLFDDTIVPPNYINTNFPNPNKLDDVIKLLNFLASSQSPVDTNHNRYEILKNTKASMLKNTISFRSELIAIKKKFPKQYRFTKIYIPTLRGLRPLPGGENSYLRRTLKDYFNNTERKNLFIFTGLEMFSDVRKHLLGDLSKRKLIENYERFLALSFFEGHDLSLIPREEGGNDVLFAKIGKEKELPIYELGDGIQQLIIMTFPLFLNPKANILLFIEEPELYLHPGLQRILLEFLTSDKFGNLQVFLTTHSNHLLDLSLDFDEISIFNFKKELEESEAEEKIAKFHVVNTSNKDRKLLEDLGVRNSSVLLTNCTIWVEGITDRLYIRKYLEIYMANNGEKIFEEDKHYSFVEYSGNNITHWSFLDKEEKPINVASLCSILFLIADRDEGKEERHEKLEEILGDRYYRLQCIEIENLLSPKVLLETIKSYKVEPKKNIKIKQESYNNKKLGKFIDSRILEPGSKKTFGADSGTLKNKPDFARKAISHISSIEDMSEEAQDIANMLYDFIRERNQ
ncbi:MAG: ATP-binding protein [candidate division Zixibacteria bacterium]